MSLISICNIFYNYRWCEDVFEKHERDKRKKLLEMRRMKAYQVELDKQNSSSNSSSTSSSSSSSSKIDDDSSHKKKKPKTDAKSVNSKNAEVPADKRKIKFDG